MKRNFVLHSRCQWYAVVLRLDKIKDTLDFFLLVLVLVRTVSVSHSHSNKIQMSEYIEHPHVICTCFRNYMFEDETALTSQQGCEVSEEYR